MLILRERGRVIRVSLFAVVKMTQLFDCAVKEVREMMSVSSHMWDRRTRHRKFCVENFQQLKAL